MTYDEHNRNFKLALLLIMVIAFSAAVVEILQ